MFQYSLRRLFSLFSLEVIVDLVVSASVERQIIIVSEGAVAFPQQRAAHTRLRVAGAGCRVRYGPGASVALDARVCPYFAVVAAAFPRGAGAVCHGPALRHVWPGYPGASISVHICSTLSCDKIELPAPLLISSTLPHC